MPLSFATERTPVSQSKPDPLVIFTPSGKRGHFPAGTPVLTAARKLGVDLDSVCGGRGKCSKCQVAPSYGEFSKHGVTVAKDALSPFNEVEARYDRIRGLISGRRLGCQATIQTDVVIDVPPESQVHKQVVRKRAEARDITLAPSIRRVLVEVEQPDMHEPTGDFERLQNALAQQWDIKGVTTTLPILSRLQKCLRKGEWSVTCTIHNAGISLPPRLIDIAQGFDETAFYGLAVDLGSTTIAGHLCNLETGEVVASAGLMNPQIRFGEDLMSRVSYGMMNEGGSGEMTAAVREGMAQLCRDVAKDAGIAPERIIDATIVCNPVMHHLFLGIDAYELGQAPFALATSDALNLSAHEVGLPLHENAALYMLPCIAGHVGADAAAVALSEAPEKSDDLVLIVDVGTNAEIILGNKNRVLACSSPTGPAFEGAQISAGQRAAPGAIERVEIDPITKEPRFKIIGSDLWSNEAGFEEAALATGVTGICGSGIIECVAEMRMAGIVDGPGLIGSAEQVGTDRCFADGRTNSYLLYDATHLGGDKITVTNRDIREIQMAKAALYSGARLLMDKFEVDTVDRIVLCGAFGAHISPKHAMILGMIPDCALDKVTSAGNAAGTGARIALLNTDARREIETTVRAIHKIETAIEPRFQEHFVNASNIPNAADSFPHLGAIVTLPNVNHNAGDGSDGGKRRRRRRG
ncbi:ASKHA domain-containing protein [Falsihalocynthiibacter sp. SS001]|uniref:ASKHA domain-containing protein n=1 Tax=Falsihalocynthiibacter sp. SS001 TaxID=3349698 RepID=UPI0036D21EF0